jgi:alkylated DNA repair dioxygenase AlkB
MLTSLAYYYDVKLFMLCVKQSGSLLQTRNVDVGRPIAPLPPLAKQLASTLEQLLVCTFDQLTVNEYEPGVGLSAHVDTHSAFTGDADAPSKVSC